MKSRLRAAFTHLAFSTLIALLVGLLVFGAWYRQPFGELLGGHELFLWVIFVNVTLGPLLTFVVFNTAKPRAELVRDIGIIVLVQLLALTYGIYVMSLARPVWVAQEGDRFRLVRRADIDMKTIGEAPATLQSLAGPVRNGWRPAFPKQPTPTTLKAFSARSRATTHRSAPADGCPMARRKRKASRTHFRLPN